MNDSSTPGTTPSVVIFDLGKVLVNFDYSIAARRIAARCKMPLEEILCEQFFKEIRAATGFAGDLAEFSSFFSDIFVPIEPMVQLHARLRRRGLPTYIFSNTNDLAITHIRRNFPFFSNFDGYILSYEQGAMKPDAKIYEAAESQSGRRAAEILYLDDRPENIAAGAARGWQVILQESPEKTHDVIRKLGLLDHG